MTKNTKWNPPLGAWGDLYPIAEPDMLMTIYNRLHDMEQRGELSVIVNVVVAQDVKS
ncbi:hypothetical protein [Candidatus Regiella insecticola]|uniref:hypothetical protein n=1 Tax=Candidatus Regiella insecticola TaxID=138073 RepID=UPI00159E64CE|nr:hypothetical protein [Candidatus Regiella insecticola]